MSVPQKVPIIFESIHYNFGASFEIYIVFNLTDVNLQLNSNTKSSAQSLNINFVQQKSDVGEKLIGTADYSLNKYLCGPVFSSFFYRQVFNMSNLELIQTDILTRTKLLGNVGIEFVQLINPSKFGTQNLTLNSLILAVSVNKIFVYSKQLPISPTLGIQMFAITNFSLPEKRCTFYLYEVLNYTAATLISNCEGINYDYRSPLLTINYNPLLPLNASFTYNFSWMKVVPLALRQIYTIVRG